MAMEKLTKEKLDRILETDKLDTGDGGLFKSAVKADPDSSALKLIVASGGSGIKAACRAIRLAENRLKPEYTQFVKFIMLDADTYVLESLDADKYPNILPLNISTPGARVRLKKELRTQQQRRFMPADFNADFLNGDGSCAVRMIGRAKLYDQSIHKVAGENQLTPEMSYHDLDLEQIVRNLFQGDWGAYRDRDVELVVLAGLSGGTGSGVFLDIPVLIKKACPQPARVRSACFLMLPDTAEQFANNAVYKRSLDANGYAALKELESFMSLPMEKGRKETFLFSDGSTYTVDGNRPLYNNPILVGDDYERAVDTIAKVLLGMMTAPDGIYSFSSNIVFPASAAIARNNIFSGMGRWGKLTAAQYPEDSHAYSGIGFASASIPDKIVIPNVISKVSGRLFAQMPGQEENAAAAGEEETAWCCTGKYLSEAEFNKAIVQMLSLPEEVEAQESSLWTNKIAPLIENKLGYLGENPWDVTYEDLAEGRFEYYLEGFKVGEAAHKGAEKLVDEINGLYQSVYIQARQLVKKYGPRVMEYLYNGDGGIDETGAKRTYKTCLASQIEYVETQLNDMKQKKAERPGALPKPETSFGYIFQRHSSSLVLKWKAAAKEWAETSVRSIIADSISDFIYGNDSVGVDFNSRILYLRDCCIRFADILEEMQNFYDAAGSSLDAAVFNEFSNKTGGPNSVNLCSDARTFNLVKSKAAAKARSVDLHQLKQALTDSFFGERGMQMWSSEHTCGARKMYDEVFGSVCRLGAYEEPGTELSLSIEDYFIKLTENAGTDIERQQIMQEEADRILRWLAAASRPALKLRADVKAPVTNIALLLPHSLFTSPGGRQILNAFQTALQHQANTAGFPGNSYFICSRHVKAGEILCCQTSVANALSDLADIDRWEEAYNQDSSDTIHVNCGETETKYTETDMRTRQSRGQLPNDLQISDEDNMLGTTGLSWRHYPAANAGLYGDSFTSFEIQIQKGHAGIENGYEARYRADVFSKKITYALQEKLIELEKNGSRYTYYLNVLPEDWFDLSVAEAPASLGKGSSLFAYLSSRNSFSRTQWPANRLRIGLSGTPFFNGVFDAAPLLQAEPEKWPREKLENLFRSYMMRIMRKNTFLYQKLEETICRYYPVRLALDAKSDSFKASRQ